MSRLRCILILASGLLAASGCGPGPASGVARREGLVVRRGSLEDRFLLTGQLRAVRFQPLVAPHTPNWLLPIRWMAPEGSAVRAGEPVIHFETSSVASGLEDTRLAATQAAAELEQQRLELEASRRDKAFEVLRLRVARDKARLDAQVPQALQAARDHQEKQLALSRAEVALQKGQAELESFEKDAASKLEVLRVQQEKALRNVERSEAALEKLVLRAPTDGVLVHGTHPMEGRKWQAGDSTWPGQTVAEVPDFGAMAVEAQLNDVDDGKIAPGLAVRCRLDTYPDRPFPGRVRSISGVAQAVDRNSSRRFFGVLIDLEGGDPAILRPGMSVKVEALRRTLEGALLVPREALDRSGPRPRVLVSGAGPVEVEVAACDALHCALHSGPPEGTALEAWP